MNKLPKTAIVGGGPAGLTAAVILNNHGYPVQVYERDAAPDHRSQGGSLDLHDDSGQVALKRAGLLDAFRAIARHEDQETRMVNPLTGEIRKEDQPKNESADRPEIDRGVLRNLLLSVLPQQVVKWDMSLSRMDDGDDGRKHLLFTDGSRIEADIVIGADGAWSCVRSALSPILPQYSGVTFMEGWLDTPSKSQSAYVGHGTMFAFGAAQGLFAQRNGLGRICIYAAIQRPCTWIEAETKGRDPRELVCSLYETWAPQLLDLVVGCKAFTERPIYQLPVDFAWEHKDGALLVGDAAHLMPPVGVGVNLAMLDASDVALAIVGSPDWRASTRDAQIAICQRAEPLMQQAIPGFVDWFSGAQRDD